MVGMVLYSSNVPPVWRVLAGLWFRTESEHGKHLQWCWWSWSGGHKAGKVESAENEAWVGIVAMRMAGWGQLAGRR